MLCESLLNDVLLDGYGFTKGRLYLWTLRCKHCSDTFMVITFWLSDFWTLNVVRRSWFSYFYKLYVWWITSLEDCLNSDFFYKAECVNVICKGNNSLHFHILIQDEAIFICVLSWYIFCCIFCHKLYQQSDLGFSCRETDLNV